MDEKIIESQEEKEISLEEKTTLGLSLIRQALGYADIQPIDLTKHVSVALKSSSGQNSKFENTSGTDVLTVFSNSDYPLSSLIVAIEPVQEGTGDPSPENVRPISGWSSIQVFQSEEYDETADPILEVTISDEAGTVYGGIVDLITGDLTVTKAMKDMGSFNWGYNTGGNFPYFDSGSFSIGASIKAGVVIGICSAYKVIPNITSSSFRSVDHNYECCCNSSGGSAYLIVQNSDYNSAADFKAAMEGVEIVYDLVNPISYKIDPEELSLLKGINNIWADCGPVMSITY